MPQKRVSRILLTGGHAATPAIAVVEEIKNRRGNIDIFWAGSKYAMPGSDSTTVEYKILPLLGAKFYPISMGKLQTKFTRYTIPLLLNIPVSFIQALFVLLKVKPDLILSFGGFSSFPVIFWAYIFRIPIILHEQTAAAGRASIASARFAEKIAIARLESQSYFPKDKLVLTGNPVMSQVLSVTPKSKIGMPPTLLVMGGSRGSQFINEELGKIVESLQKDYKIIHIMGETNGRSALPSETSRYKVLSFVDPREMAKYYRQSDIIISRAGANSVSEIMYICRPAILIPLPRTYASEQVKNAEFAEKFGIAKVMREPEVNPESLIREINKMKETWQKRVDVVRKKTNPDVRSAGKLVDILESYLP